MRLVFLAIIIMLLASCSQENISIKTSSSEKAGVKDAYIRTTETIIEKETQYKNSEPKIDIVTPKDGEILNGNKIFIMVNVSNFKLVAPDMYPKEGQGYIQIMVDGMEARSSNTEFVFQNESNGTHVIKAELILSNGTLLPYSKTIKVVVP